MVGGTKCSYIANIQFPLFTSPIGIFVAVNEPTLYTH